jgi:hypothetical protein
MSRPLLPAVPFVRGVNLPWLSYGNDFGRSVWHPEGGVHRRERRELLDAVFGRLAATGIDLVRWFLLCDGRAGLCEDAEGTPEGLDDRIYQDFKTAIAYAEAYGLALMPVLLDFHWCRPPRDEAGVRCGGRAAHLVDSGRRACLMERVLRPLLSRFGERKAIAAWDLINEPEWVTFSWKTWDFRHAVLPDAMHAFIGEAAALVHECTDHPVTVGLASAASLPQLRGLGLDFYQAHWYDRLDDESPLTTPAAYWNVPGPVLLGEFPTRGSRFLPADIEALARSAGYRGALAWSLCASDAASDPDAAWRWASHGPDVAA